MSYKVMMWKITWVGRMTIQKFLDGIIKEHEIVLKKLLKSNQQFKNVFKIGLFKEYLPKIFIV